MKLTQNSITLLLNNHKIVLIVTSFIIGILLNEYLSYPWILAGITGLFSGITALYFRNLRFLLFIPLGLVFAANTIVVEINSVSNYIGEKIDLEGVLYRSPQSREEGSRLYIDTQFVIRDGVTVPTSGKVIIYSNEENKLAYGDRVRILDLKLRPIENFKNPGGFNLKEFYERQGIYDRGFVQGEESIISFGREKSYSPILHYIDRIRIKFGNFVRTNFQSPQSNILNALTIGEKGAIPQDVRTEFSKAGVAHVLAISGLHVGAVAIAFFFLIKWLLKRSEYLLLRFQVPRLAAAMTILPIFLYTAIAGFSTSTVRAFIMISLYLFAIVIGREEQRVNTLSAAALIILLWHPWSLFELSFQLSFAAVFAILLAHKFYPFKFNTLEDKFYSLVKTTVAATLATFPLVANSFGILPLISIPANLILVPLVEFIIVPISLVSFIIFLVSQHVADLLITLNMFFIDMLTFGVELVLKIPYSSLTIPPMNAFSWTVFLILVLSLLLYSSYKKVKYAIPFVLIGLIITLIYPVPGKSIKGVLEVNFLDVGKNKSVLLIKLPNNEKILIDGGYSKNDRNGYLEKTVVTSYLLKSGIRTIDLLVLTSTDKDHLRGAEHLIEKFDIKTIYTNGEKLDGGLWRIINEHDIEWKSISKIPDSITEGEVNFDILRTDKGFHIEDSSRPKPIVFKLTYGNSSFLFGESLNKTSVQNELIDSIGENIRSKVLYIPNLDLDRSLFEFVDFVSPDILITGNITQLIDETTVLQTENLGTVSISTNGIEIDVRSFLNEK